MRWTTKARIQRTLSALPSGHRLNYVLQRYVTRSLPRPDGELREIVRTSERHLRAIAEHAPGPLEQLRLFEFGAGYDLAGPLASAALGATDQLLYDIRPVARAAVVRSTVARLRALGLDLAPFDDDQGLDPYLAAAGIRYVAPADARATGLPDGSIDVVTTTSVLEHVSIEDLRAIMAELHRILVPGGIATFAVDYHDHFAGADPTIDGLHFLRFDDAEWNRWNSDLQHQNRLRHLDYVHLFEEAGFLLSAVDAVADPAFPLDPPLAERFVGRDDLHIGDGWFVLTRPR